MASKAEQESYRSVSAQPQTAEPESTARTASPSRELSPNAKRNPSAISSSIPTLRKQPSSTLEAPGSVPAPTSAGNSPHNSRNSSPIRPTVRQDAPRTATRSGGSLRSRQNSHDASPSRLPVVAPPSSTPSAASIQRALSATSIPQLQPGPVTEAVSKLHVGRTARSSGQASGESTPTTPHWPVSPRIKSPPPSAVSSRRNSTLSQKRPDTTPAPSIVVQGSTPSSTPSSLSATLAGDAEKEQLQPPTKVASRGPSGPKAPLETVQENTPPSASALTGSPAHSFSSSKAQSRSSDEDRTPTQESAGDESAEKQTRIGESESEGNRSDTRGRRANQTPTSAPRPKTVPAKNTFTPLSSAKSRQPDGASRNMTVETETVSSIPQSALSTGDRSVTGRADGGGSVRLKPSNETIRPRKDRKRVSRKTPSIQNGTASSKADIFEARVASAVDQANSSDSDETFVYESNPPEAQHRSGRNHSRTPSATSMASQSERRSGRGYGSGMETHRVAGKRSMKFSNNPYNVLDSPTDMGDGTVRAHHPRHISRLGGRGTSSHSSLYDQDSPFTQASKLRSNLANSTRQSRPTTPRSVQSGQYRAPGPWSKKNDISQYDFDGEGADDERMPLVGSVRTARNRGQVRRFDSEGGRSIEGIYNIRPTPWLSRFGGYVLSFIVVVLIVIGASGFLVMSNKTMYDVQIRRIQNVLASEQELMLDMLVGAVNPNVLGITVTELDVSVFAKSSHLFPSPPSGGEPIDVMALGSKRSQRRTASQKRSSSPGGGTPWQDPAGHLEDGGSAPAEGDSPAMLLGRIFHFDQALYFDGSPFKRHMHFSVGQMRLMAPGNKTEAGGSDRWERVLQYPFELIMRGVVRYQLPITNRVQTAAIAGSVLVHPEEGVDEAGYMRVEGLDHPEAWEWVELDELDDEGKSSEADIVF